MDAAELLRRGFSRETAIRRDASGRWFVGTEAIDHPGLRRAFDGWIDRADDGRLCLRNDINWAYVQIDGPPYAVKSLRSSDGSLTLALSGSREEPLDIGSLRVGPDGSLWCDVRSGRVPARFDSHAATQLAEYLHEQDEDVYLEFGAERRRLPIVTDPMSPLP